MRKKYGTLEELNARWGTVVWSQIYSDWGQIDLPFPTPAYHNPALMLDYKRFISDSATDYLNDQVEILRRYRPDDFLTHNGVFKNINYYAFSRDLDLYAYDNYPTFKDSPRYPTGAMLTLVRGFNGRLMIMEQLTGPAGQTYLLRTPRPGSPGGVRLLARGGAAHEATPPGEMRLWAMQTVAHGADGLLHFRWRSARTRRGGILVWRARPRQRPPRALRRSSNRKGRNCRKSDRRSSARKSIRRLPSSKTSKMSGFSITSF